MDVFFLLHDVLYALKIRWNLDFVPILLELWYNLNFYGACLEIFLNSILIETRHLVNGFIILETMLDGSSYDSSYFWYVTSFSNNEKEIDVITWHARLSHIWQ